jgi:hypothetical protein
MATTVKKTKTPAKPRTIAAKKEIYIDVKKTAKPAAKKSVKLASPVAKPRKPGAKKVTTDRATKPVTLLSPSREQIEQLARKYWAERGYQDGQAEQDWLRAEHDLQQKAS